MNMYQEYLSQEGTGSVKRNTLNVDNPYWNKRLITYFMVGTLGVITTDNPSVGATANWGIVQIETVKTYKSPKKVMNNSAQNDIVHLRTIVNISTSELSRLFNISIPAVHEWSKGKYTPSPQNELRMSNLVHAIDILHKSGVDITPSTLRRKISGECSIFDALKEGKDVIQLAKVLSTTLKHEARQRQILVARHSKLHSSSYSELDFGAPHFNENV